MEKCMTAPLTIVVTGAPAEVAQSVARRLATHQQMHVVLVSRRRTKMRMPSNVEHIAGVDLADYVAVKRLFRHGSVRRAKRLALILGAGRFPNFPEVLKNTQPDTVAAMRGNFLTFANCIHAAIPLMRRNHYGRIIGFTSLTQSLNFPFSAGFSAAKAACESFAATVANENSRFNITANLLALATVNTRNERKLKPKADRQAWLTPDEVANCVEWLIESDLPTINGARLPLYHYSPSFFGEAYLGRISRTMP
jgi:NAD(P)-dependent dehydrogenase (short-subunit alcohol dehydrogenase family)